MSDEQKDKNAELLDHDYDGIQEYDNPLPNWWLTTFLGTIIFAFIYLLHYTVGGGPNQYEELEAAMKELPQSVEKIWSEEDLKNKMEGPENIEKGKTVFAGKCSACHGAEGQGGIGPNLADLFWLHGKGQRAHILDTVAKGVTEKGMPAWTGMISEDEIILVSGFVYSLRNTQPKDPKAPQGEEYKE